MRSCTFLSYQLAVALTTTILFLFNTDAEAHRIYVRDNAAQTSYYTSGTGNDNNTGTENSPLASISQAVFRANAGDTVYIDVGNYFESVTINKRLWLIGVGAQQSPNTGTRTLESTINSSGMASIEIITNDPVVVQGLKFITTNGDAILSYYSNTRISLQKNLFEGCKGIFLLNPDTVALIDNRFSNLDPSTSAAVFIPGDYNGSTGSYMVAYHNSFVNSQVAALNLSNVKGLIYENLFFNIVRFGISLANRSSFQVYSNTFENIANPDPSSASTLGAGVRFFTPLAGMVTSISNNFFLNNYVGVAVSAGGGNMSGLNVHVNNNFFSGNNYAFNHAGSGNLDGICNWYQTTDMAAIAPQIVGPVTWMPYLMTGADNQPSTPGFQPVPNMCASNVLPVSILNFAGQKLNTVNRLSWTVSQLGAGSEVELQRSVNGSAFLSLRSVVNVSSYDDGTFGLAINSYRLKITEPGGTIRYSAVVTINNKRTGKTSVGPNPFVDHITVIAGEDFSNKVQMQLFDMKGKLVKKLEQYTGGSSLQLTDLSGLPRGQYVLECFIDIKRSPAKSETFPVYRLIVDV
jgi:hypothetical protein